MEQARYRYITVAYQLFADNAAGIHELIEEAPKDYPFQFITNLGMALDSFESQVRDLNEGDTFDFTIPMEEAYGPYDEKHVISVPKETFFVDGRFDSEVVSPGKYIPLVNEDGYRFDGLVVDVKEDTVIIDLNSPLAGKTLHYKGTVVTAREATPDEIQGAFNLMAGGSSGCGCGCGCGDGEEEGGCGCGSSGCGCGDGESTGGCGCGGGGCGCH